MPTSSELVKQKRASEAWDEHMRQVRATEAAKPKVAPEPVAPLLGPDGQPLQEPGNG